MRVLAVTCLFVACVCVCVCVSAWPSPRGGAGRLVTRCKVVGVAATFINCTGVPSAQTAQNFTLFRITNKTPAYTNSTVAQYDIGIVLFARNRLDEKITFNRNLVVGSVTFNRKCHRRTTACLLELSISEEVSTLNVFQYMSNEDKYWNFQEDIYRSSDGILEGVYVHFHYGGDPLWILGLTNTSIQHLSLNQIRAPTIKLGSMPYLNAIELYDMYIDSLPSDMNEIAPRLAFLNADSNCFSIFPSSLRLLTNLTYVTLKGNKDCPVYTDFVLLKEHLSGMNRLKELDLSSNNLKNFEFTALKALTSLSLINCSLNKIQFDEMIAKMSIISDLKLSHNHLNDADLRNLTYLPKLIYLDVSFNSLTGCPPMRKRTVSTIDVSGNNISDIRTCAMKDCDISSLILSSNKIVSWKDSSLFLKDGTQNSNWLSWLDISYNPIDLFNDEMIHSLDLLDTLHVDGLSINCEKCQLYKLQQWLGNTSVEVLPSLEENGPFVCRSPPEYSQMNILDVKVNPADCVISTPNLILPVVIPCVSIVSLSVLVMIIAYRKRVEIMYMLHLYNLRRNFKKRSQYQRPVEGNLFDAFICFSSHDQTWVMTTLRPLLEQDPHKYRLCMHNRDFPLGTTIIENIDEALERSTKTLIVLSKHFVRSKWCRWELEMAYHKLLSEEADDSIILLQLEPLDLHTLPRNLRHLMMTRTYLEWPRSNDVEARKRALRRLIDALGPSIESSV